MAITNATYCVDSGRTESINFNGNIINVGEVWMATQNTTTPAKEPFYCFEITSGTNEPSSLYSATTLYTNCDECFRATYTVVSLTNCIGGGGYAITYNSFDVGVIPQIGQVFSGQITIGQKVFTSCFEIQGFEQVSEESWGLLFQNDRIGTSSQPIQSESIFTDCIDCLTGATIGYNVIRCTDGVTDCVGLIGIESPLVDHLISYSNGVDIFCGIVSDPNTGCSPILSFIQDFGVPEDGCEECLSSGNTKILIQNCLIPENTDIVWASALFGIGDASNLSTNDGCYEVVGPTGDPVTINYYLNFDPQPDCQNCIECNGYTVTFSSCTGGEGISMNSYEYIGIGDFFYHPFYGCCEVTDIQNGTFGNHDVFSFNTFSSCGNCEYAHFLWVATGCSSGSNFTFYVSVPSSAMIGDVYQLYWGETPFICVVLTEIFSDEFLPAQLWTSDNPVTCEECSSDFIGVRAINCDTGQDSLFNLTQEEYLNFYGVRGTQTFKSNGQCYFISNLCPQIPTGTTASITDYYGYCFECTSIPDLPPISAGTEYTICVICEDCCQSGTTATTINPPHPVWTRPDGREVILLDAVQLGGMFGLNS